MQKDEQQPDLTVIMPCLNEESTVGLCVEEALAFIREHGIKGEVLVVDNGSVDASAQAAARHGAFVLKEPERGYGSAIRTGLAAGRGRVLILGDCDTTYDFRHMEDIYEPLAHGSCDMIVGNRFACEMERGAMPFSHRIGVRFLSALGRWMFHTDVYDFHCGLRGISGEAVERLSLHTSGMEFATEMIAEAARHKLRISQIPVQLRRCAYKRSSKLRTVRDGFRHLGYIMLPENRIRKNRCTKH